MDAFYRNGCEKLTPAENGQKGGLYGYKSRRKNEF